MRVETEGTEDQDTTRRFLQAAEKVLSDPLLASHRQTVRKLSARLSTRRFHLAVLGQFKRGKSTLVNALVGQKILPVGLVPVTAIPTFLSAGPETRIRVAFQNAESSCIPIEQLADYVSEKGNPHNRREVASVEIEVQTLFLREGVVLVDTPGIGSGHRHNTDTTLRLLPECDAAVFVLSPDPPVTEAELAFLTEVTGHAGRLFFVLNKTDLLSQPEIEETVDYLRLVLRERFPHLVETDIFVVSARKSLQGACTSDHDRGDSSGIPRLQQALLQFLRDEKTATLNQVMETRARGALRDALTLIEIQARSLELSTEDLTRKARDFEVLQGRIREELLRLHDSAAADRKRFAERVRVYAKELAAECHQHVMAALNETVQSLSPRVAPGQAQQTLVEHAGHALGEFFEHHHRAWLERGLTEADDLLARLVRRASELLAEASARVAEIFDVARATSSTLSEIHVHWPTFYWKTHYWHGELGDFLTSALRALLGRKRMVESILEQLSRELEKLATRNANVLFNELDDRVSQAVRDADHQLDGALQEAAEAVGRALDSVGEHRGRGESAASSRLAQLRHQRDQILHLLGDIGYSP